DASLTASGTGPGTVTLTAGLKVFNQLLAAGNARITLTGGLSGEATITQFIDQTRVTANITRAFPSASIAAGKWRLSTNEQRGIRCVESQNMQVLTTYALATWTTTDATTCTNHDCAGTGYLVDKDFMQVIDSKSSGFNTFRIPTLANSSIVGGVTIRQP